MSNPVRPINFPCPSHKDFNGGCVHCKYRCETCNKWDASITRWIEYTPDKLCRCAWGPNTRLQRRSRGW